jgi:hypothetical protein
MRFEYTFIEANVQGCFGTKGKHFMGFEGIKACPARSSLISPDWFASAQVVEPLARETEEVKRELLEAISDIGRGIFGVQVSFPPSISEPPIGTGESCRLLPVPFRLLVSDG